jgi:hypothetical protein
LNKNITNYKAEVNKRLPEVVKKVNRELYGAARLVAKAPVDIVTDSAAQPS